MEQESSRFITASDILVFFSRFFSNYTTYRLEFDVIREQLGISIRQFACTSIARIIQEYRYFWIRFLVTDISLGGSRSRASNELVASRMRENKRFIKRYMLQGSDNDKIPWFDLVHPVADRFRWNSRKRNDSVMAIPLS